jgi:hypothetical protein
MRMSVTAPEGRGGEEARRRGGEEALIYSPLRAKRPSPIYASRPRLSLCLICASQAGESLARETEQAAGLVRASENILEHSRRA